MPEGHSVHRIARQFTENFVGHPCEAESPQGRFVEGAAALTGREMLRCFAVGKQMFAEFGALEAVRGAASPVWLRVHLGIYGAWDFAGDITTKLGQTGEYGRAALGETRTSLESSAAAPGTQVPQDADAEDSVTSIGAPRRTRLRMAESEREHVIADAWPPEPVGAVRLRLLTETVVADLRGPTACELLGEDGVRGVLARLGPDPLVDSFVDGQRRFVDRVGKRRTPIGQLLMDQSVIAGIGNIYRAEILFRAGLNPYLPGNEIPVGTLQEIWADWDRLLRVGVAVGRMLTIDGLTGEEYQLALRDVHHRHWVYGRAGQACRRCGTLIALAQMQNRKLYWCPSCQR